jgi:beta-lactam-binding protein with PASTA domain
MNPFLFFLLIAVLFLCTGFSQLKTPEKYMPPSYYGQQLQGE